MKTEPLGPDLQRWTEEGHRNAIDIADMLGVRPKVYTRDPMSIIPALNNYVARAPLHEFEQDDWITLHADLVSFLAVFLIQQHGARWALVGDPAGPVGWNSPTVAAAGDAHYAGYQMTQFDITA